MTRLPYRDGEGSVLLPAGADPHAMALHVTGAHTRVDTGELAAVEERLAEARRLLGHAADCMLRARGHLRLDAHLAPGTTLRAVAAVEETVEGPDSFAVLGTAVADLEDKLREARWYYEEAEVAARCRPVAAPRRTGPAGLLAPHSGVGVLPGMLGGSGLLADLAGLLPGRSGLEVALLALAGGERGPRGVAVQRGLRALAERAQHGVPSPGGGPLLGPVERTVLPLTLALHALTDRAVGVAPLSPPRVVDAAEGSGGLLRALDALMPVSGGRPGTIEVRRTEHPDGRRSWVVVVPGTQRQVPGSANPLDNTTNVEALVGLPTDVEVGVARAMEQAGIARGEEVALVGHSQGGMTAMRLAADPLFARRFAVVAVLTAGSPVGGMPAPPRALVLSLEHLEDAVVGLDGRPNRPGRRRTTVVRSLAGGERGRRKEVGPGRAHAVAEYARTADLAEASGDAAVRAFSDRLGDVAGGAGTTVTAATFEIRRVPGG